MKKKEFFIVLDIWNLCKNNPNIRTLKLTYCTQLTNNGVRAALHMLNKLEYLDLEGIKDEGTGFFVDQLMFAPNTSLSINFKLLKKYESFHIS